MKLNPAHSHDRAPFSERKRAERAASARRYRIYPPRATKLPLSFRSFFLFLFLSFFFFFLIILAIGSTHRARVIPPLGVSLVSGDVNPPSRAMRD